MNNQILGIAGELRVMSELLLRGFNPAKSYFDNGVDLILSDGIKIQVKTSLKKTGNGKKTTLGNNTSESYRFQMRKGNDKKKVLPKKYVDFVICWGIQDNVFWIIPAENIGELSTLSLSYPKKSDKNRLHRFYNKWIFRKGGEK